MGSTITPYPELDSAKRDIEGLDGVLALRRTVETSVSTHLSTRWVDTSLDDLKEVVSELLEQALSLPETVLEWNVTEGLRNMLAGLVKSIPLLVLLRSNCMRSRHWKQVLRVVGRELETNSSSIQEYTLEEFVNLRPGDFANEFQAIVAQVRR